MPEPLTIAPLGDRQIVVTRDFDAPRELVFLCYSRADLMRRWYGLPDWTTIACEIDFRVGGKFRLAQRSPEGFVLASQGVYTRIEAPERIDQTEYYDDDWTRGGSENSLVLTPLAGNRTRSVITITYATPEGRAAAAASPMATGMEIGFTRLDAVLADEQA